MPGQGYLSKEGQRWLSEVEGGTMRREADMKAPAVDFTDVSFSYGAAPRHHTDMRQHKMHAGHSALTDFTLRVARGSRVVIVGENGAGKSTFLEMVAGKHMARSGTARVLGLDAFNDTVLNNHTAFVGAPWPPEVSWGATVESHLALETGLEEDHVHDLMRALHIDPTWRIDRISAGQKRRIQLLLGFLRRREILCLDECSTDIDIIERHSMLEFFRKESDTHGVTVLYATHIFDGLDGWATHVVRMVRGKVVFCAPLEGDHQKRGTLYKMALDWILADKEARAEIPTLPSGVFDDQCPTASGAAVEVVGLKYSFPKRAGGNEVFRSATTSIMPGSRVLVIGTNGSGKSTLLRILAGRHLVPTDVASVFGRDAFSDTKLMDTVAFSGDWWLAPPDWDTTVRELLDEPDSSRTQWLMGVLNVDYEWDMKRVSAGQRRRIQLLLSLEKRKRVLLLDEVTADMDVVQREKFLKFLKLESEHADAPATVLYSTHIFEGLDGWATHVMVVDGGEKSVTNGVWEPGMDTLSQVFSIVKDKKDREWADIEVLLEKRKQQRLMQTAGGAP
eukprot:Hpha_TRINITY_DN15616_c3_g8::TRINITY_DN15616_c3_g8_i1::g.101695::m.101695/K12608/CAF16; CCR4-NOT complex subunit CAF16